LRRATHVGILVTVSTSWHTTERRSLAENLERIFAAVGSALSILGFIIMMKDRKEK
jgi:predicted membrane channel-forming protein YqfA (hemolysin III family)